MTGNWYTHITHATKWQLSPRACQNGEYSEHAEKLAEANFSEGQKMVMLEHNHPNSIHLAIKDAVDHKGAGLYDFMVRLIDVESWC